MIAEWSGSGPPGVGKTLTAEALSEYYRRPLYTVRFAVRFWSLTMLIHSRSVLENWESILGDWKSAFLSFSTLRVIGAPYYSLTRPIAS